MNIRYTERMKTIVDMAKPCDTVADIGADHALISINLVLSGKAKRVYACDINEGPIRLAGKNVKKFGLSGAVIPMLSDGLSMVYDKADSAVIAGMGGELITDILSRVSLSTIKSFVLQPMSHAERLRAALSGLGLKISEERLVLDSGRIYCVMGVVHGDEKYSREEILAGPCLIREKPPLFSEYTKRLIKYEESKSHDRQEGELHLENALILKNLIRSDLCD